MKYYIICDAKDNDPKTSNFGLLFLADRSLVRAWWTPHITQARIFSSEDEAKQSLSKLRYNNPRIVNQSIARSISDAGKSARSIIQ